MKLHVRADWRDPTLPCTSHAHTRWPAPLSSRHTLWGRDSSWWSKIPEGPPGFAQDGPMQLSYTENAAHEGSGLYIVKTTSPVARIVQRRSGVLSLLWLRRLHIPFHERRRLHLRALVHGARGAWPISIACRTPHHCSSSPTTDGSEHVLVLEGKRELKRLLRTFVD